VANPLRQIRDGLSEANAGYGGPCEDSAAATAIENAANLVSFVFAQVYFPTSSNGLKDIAGDHRHCDVAIDTYWVGCSPKTLANHTLPQHVVEQALAHSIDNSTTGIAGVSPLNLSSTFGSQSVVVAQANLAAFTVPNTLGLNVTLSDSLSVSDTITLNAGSLQPTNATEPVKCESINRMSASFEQKLDLFDHERPCC
jgi:hypothetical protein